MYRVTFAAMPEMASCRHLCYLASRGCAHQFRGSTSMMACSVRHIRLGRLLSDETGQGSSPSFLPPAQPALLTLTADGSMRIWVEVTVAPPPPPLPAPVSSSTPSQHPKPPEQVWRSILLQEASKAVNIYQSMDHCKATSASSPCTHVL